MCVICGFFGVLLLQDGPVLKQAQTRPFSRAGYAGKLATEQLKEQKLDALDKNRWERFKTTRVIALSECNLKV